MFCRCINFTAGLVVMLLFAPAAFADASRDTNMRRISEGNPVAGKAKSALCQACHGRDGNSADDNVPKLAGQYAEYMQKRIHDFQSSTGHYPVMGKQAAALTNKQDVLDIAAYFASQEPMKGERPADNQVGRTFYLDDATGCTQCHVIRGVDAGFGNPLMPRIAGQHELYMYKQLHAYKRGDRTSEINGMMIMILGEMSDEEIDDVTSYVSGLSEK